MEPGSPQSHEHFPLIDAIDHEILMHREAHFGGLFSVMLDYYQREGKGVQPEFKIEKIEKLAELENNLKENIAALFLSGDEIQKIADSRAAYQKLRDIYSVEQPKYPFPRLIADLILSEEEEAELEIQAIVTQKEKIVSFLIDLLRNESFYDPLFPGYGEAPSLAAKSLGLIGDKKAIISLFEAIGQSDFFADEVILKAFQAIGSPAKEFLMRVVKSRPLNEDNEKAAIALMAFKDEEDVANLCFNLLQEADILKDPCLSTYLILACEGLKEPQKREAFVHLSTNPSLSKTQKEEIRILSKDWAS